MDLNNVSQLIFKDGLWWHHDAIVVPNVVVGESNLGTLREYKLYEHHDSLYSGHMGISKTLKKIQTRFWWPKMREDAQTYVNSCDVCQRSKAPTTQPGGLSQPLKILERK